MVALPKRLGELIVVPATAAIIILLHAIPLTHDVVWQLWLARQMQHGVKLYGQLNELNPPLWFWMAVPIQRLSAVIGTTPNALLVSVVCLLGMASSLFVGALGHFAGSAERAWAMTATLAVCIFISLFDFAQREQMALIGAIPYAFIIAARLDAWQLDFKLTLAAALFASFGFALKHYFALVPLLLEVVLLMRQRRSYRPIRVETATLAVTALIYVTTIALFAPDFITRIVPMVKLAYGGYETPLWMSFDEPPQFIWAITILVLGLTGIWRRLSSHGDVQALTISMFGFFLAYLAQRKGWQYHAIATSGMAAMLLASAGFSWPQRLKDFTSRPLVVGVFALSFAMSLVQGPYLNNREKLAGLLVDRVKPGGTVMMIASNPMWGWPTVEDRRRIWASRYYTHWILPAIGRARVDHTETPEMRDLEMSIKEETLVDIVCSSPDLIVVENHEPNFVTRPASFDTLDFFNEDFRFHDYLAKNYRREVNGHWLRAFYRTTPRTEPAIGCRHIW